MRRALQAAAAAALLGAASVHAQSQPADLQPLPEAPPPPAQLQSGEVIEPDVRIITSERKKVTEYRVNGELRALKVEPEGFPAYWLVDTTGDGRLETRTTDHQHARELVPHWVIFTW